MDPIKCGVAIIRRGSEYLIAQRNEGDSFPLHWEFPGGKREENESFEECIVREAKEEIDIAIRIVRKLKKVRGHSNARVFDLHFYLCEWVSGAPRALECKQVQWVEGAELKNYQFPPANDSIIRLIGNPSFK